MSNKRRGHDQDAGGGGDKRPRRHKNLYFVLDDWDNGFSIHKIDADTLDSDDQRSGHLPEPPALRLEPPVGLMPHSDPDRIWPHPEMDMSFAALGTKIFALTRQRCGLVYDADTAVVSVGAHAPAQMACGFGIFLAVGEVLYALTDRYFDTENPYSFQAMSAAEGWSWNWKTLPPPTFRRYVRSYALHPDCRTIFMTATDDRGCMATYSFDTMDSAWRSHGRWLLPFLGQGHYDSELDAWVGLNQDGYICACQPVSPSFQSTAPCFYVDCKTTKDKMFSKKMKHMRDSLSLTYMGASKFCLVECLATRKAKKGRPTYGAQDGHVIHLTIFGLKYNHRGELQIKDHQSTRSFLVSRHIYHFRPHAFWM